MKGTLPAQIKHFMEKLEEMKVTPDTFIYNLIIRQCVRTDRMATGLFH